MPNGQQLAMHGGEPVRRQMLPYSRQLIENDDVKAVTEVLQSDWLTTGPKVEEFEHDFAVFAAIREAVAVGSGSAALHAAAFAAGIGPGTEVIVTPMTFASSVNCVVFQGGIPVFVDVDPETLLIDPTQIEARVTAKTKAIIAVDYAGQPCEYEELKKIKENNGLILIDDASHSVGGSYKNRPVGSLADLTTFSFHPVKNFTTGEGGMVTTDDPTLAKRMRSFRNHGITSDHKSRAKSGDFAYEMQHLGYNYRLSDIHCALGVSQLKKLPSKVTRRQEIARLYDDAFNKVDAVLPLHVRSDVSHAYHLYVIRLNIDKMGADRSTVFSALRAEGIGVNVHYVPVHCHPFYRVNFPTRPGMLSVAEAAYEKIISLPIFPQMNDEDAEDVVAAIKKVIKSFVA